MFALTSLVVEPPMPEKAGWQGEMPFLTMKGVSTETGDASTEKNWHRGEFG
jgi:hypothetical protein